jgi:O-antigen/teichoic acid export membrane protein
MAAFASDPAREFIFFSVAVNILVLGITGNISLVLQAVNRMKGYAFLNAADKIFFTIALVALFAPELRTFWFLIAVDLVGKIAVLIALLFRYPQLYAGSFAGMAVALMEFRENLRSGIQLMAANLSGMLVLGIGRIIIEYFGSVEIYSYYAFAISLANIVLVSIASMSVVIYPNLKRQEDVSYLRHFERVNSAYSDFSLLLITSYFAALAFILHVATSYAPVVEFLNVVFVITVLQGKMQLVNNTFYMALRLEGAMLRANLISLLIAGGLSTLGYMLTQSVVSIAYATLLTMLLRVYASEIFLRRHMAGPWSNGPLLEAAVLAGFLALTTFASPIAGCLAWSVVIVWVTLKHRGQIVVTVRKLRNRGR